MAGRVKTADARAKPECASPSTGRSPGDEQWRRSRVCLSKCDAANRAEEMIAAQSQPVEPARPVKTKPRKKTSSAEGAITQALRKLSAMPACVSVSHGGTETGGGLRCRCAPSARRSRGLVRAGRTHRWPEAAARSPRQRGRGGACGARRPKPSPRASRRTRSRAPTVPTHGGGSRFPERGGGHVREPESQRQ